MDCILHELNGFFTNDKEWEDLGIWLRLGWNRDGSPIDPGDIQTLQRGTWLEMY